MAKKMPVGTIRSWQSGDVIKAHDNSIFSNGWLPLSTSEQLEEIGRSCDQMANRMINQKLPINGEKFLDHEITEFKKPEGKEFGPYVPDDFKQYGGFYGAAKYSFRNEFSKRYMNPKIKLAELINSTLLERNEDKARELNKHSSQFNEIHLTDEEIDTIKKTVKRNFNNSAHKPMDVSEANDLKGVVERTYNQLLKGLNFEGTEKEVYNAAKQVADSLPMEYERLGIKREAREKAIAAINAQFSDNWGLRESFKSYIDDKYSDYIRKYKNQIYKDEAASQEKLFGIKLDADPDKFYPKLYEKVGEDILAQKSIKWSDIRNNYKGRVVFLENGKKFEIGKDSLLDDNDESQIREQLFPPKYPYKELIQLRFEVKYGKVIEGNWPVNTLMAIHNIENIMNGLPDGHFLTNKNISLITNTTYRGGENGGYAWYASKEKRINLSEDCVSSVQMYGKLSNPEEFNCVMAHEIGHAVSDKFGRDGNLLYKQFVVACGWSYQQKPIKEGKQATGSDEDIKREGSNQDIRLITQYAQKSPEEAFAEYYSFYYNNKKLIDHWLESGNDTLLKHKTELHVASGYDGKPLSAFTDYNTEHTLNHPNDDVDRLAHNLKLNSEKHFDIDLINPWKTKLTSEEEVAISKKVVGERKGWDPKRMPPAVVVKQKDTYLIIDGGHRREQSKIKKKYLPSIVVSEEAYDQLKKRGASDGEISNWAYHQNKDRIIPYQEEPTKMVTGISYRNKVVSATVLKASQNIFKKMKTIFESPDLKKALFDLGIGEEAPTKKLSWKSIKKALSNLLQKSEVPIENKQQYADNIIRNPQGEILLMLRTSEDDFQPGVWSLPGGKIEKDESPYDAAKRELFEETGIQSDLMPVTTIEKDNCVIHYFETILADPMIYLDNAEHQNLSFVPFEDLSKYDLILDLGEILHSLKDQLIPIEEAKIYFSNPEEEIALDKHNLTNKWIEVNSLFDNEEIRFEQWFDISELIKKAAAYETICRAFDNDDITSDQFTSLEKQIEKSEEFSKLHNLAKICSNEELETIIKSKEAFICEKRMV